MKASKLLTLGILGGSSASTPFPLTIPGLALWLDASDSATLFQSHLGTTPAAAANDVVGYWKDKSGAGRNAIQATTDRKPTLQTAVLGGRNIIRWDGTDDVLVSTFGATLTQPNTIWLLAVRGAGINYYFDGIDTSNRHAMWSPEPRTYAGTTLIMDPITTTNWNLFSLTFNGVSSNLRVNGVSNVSGDEGSHALTGLTIGARFNTVEFGQLDIAELIIANVTQTAATIAATEAYLTTKWLP